MAAFDWWLTWGPKLKQLENIARKRGKLPAALQSKPDPDAAVDWFFGAFTTLGSSRDGAKAIKLSEIKAYAEMYPLIVPVDEFVSIIQAIDKVLVERA